MADELLTAPRSSGEFLTSHRGRLLPASRMTSAGSRDSLSTFEDADSQRP